MRRTLCRGQPELRQVSPQRVDRFCVRWRTCRSRVRNSIARAWLASLLRATKRMVGRVAASTIASASAVSFFCRFTDGFTYIGAISRSSCPSSAASRPQ